jgi:hypothetical protein
MFLKNYTYIWSVYIHDTHVPDVYIRNHIHAQQWQLPVMLDGSLILLIIINSWYFEKYQNQKIDHSWVLKNQNQGSLAISEHWKKVKNQRTTDSII